MDVNFQKELDRKMNLWRDGDVHPSLLLHSCCAPCSSYCLTYLADVFDITLYFYNPNITEKSEYDHRLSELVRLAREMPLPRKVVVEPGPWDPDRFFEMAKGLEDAPERGARCVKCYTMRLDETARVAADMKADFFATTLTLSPLKDIRSRSRTGRTRPILRESRVKPPQPDTEVLKREPRHTWKQILRRTAATRSR